MSVFSEIVDVSGQAAYPTLDSPQVVIPFEPRSIAVINEDGVDDAFVSFDGVNDHGHLIGGTATEFKQRVTKVWLKRGAVGSAPTNIQITAEG